MTEYDYTGSEDFEGLEDFEDFADEDSTEAGSGINGGDLIASAEGESLLQSRRGFLRLGVGAVGLAAGLATGLVTALSPLDALAAASTGTPRVLSLFSPHTREKVSVRYWAKGRYDRRALKRIDVLLRDHRAKKVHQIDPRVIDFLYLVQKKTGYRGTVEVLSGYRSPHTNMVKYLQGDGVARQSFHTKGQAIDIRIPGANLSRIYSTALNLHAGGVGFYPEDGFVHIDSGPVRTWMGE